MFLIKKQKNNNDFREVAKFQFLLAFSVIIEVLDIQTRLPALSPWKGPVILPRESDLFTSL